MLTCHIFLGLPTILPSVSLTRPLSPLLSPCSCLQLLAWLGFLFCSTAESSWVLLFWKECESVWLPKSLSGDLGGQSPKIWFRTSFGPRSHLVKIVTSQNPAPRGSGKALQWSAAWSAAAVVVAAWMLEITSKFVLVCWKCHEIWCAMRRMIVLTVQTCSNRHMVVNFWLTSVH